MINRHLRLILSYIDLMKVYPVFNNFTLIKQDTFAQVNLKFNGWLTLQKVQVQVKNITNNNNDTIDILNNQKGYWNWEGTQNNFSFEIPISNPNNSEARFRLNIFADQDFFEQKNPDPKVYPQTYVVQSRNITSDIYAKIHPTYLLL